MKKILIFGISGFVGNYLSKELIDYNYDVYGSDRIYNEELPKTVKFYDADIMDYEEVQKIVNDVEPDAIINLAAVSSVGNSWNIPQATMQINVIGALNIMEAIRKSEFSSKILLVGSSEEYQECDAPISERMPLDANNPYGISKVTQERFASLYKEKYGLKVYYVRPFNHTGIGQKDTFVLPSFCKQIADIDKAGVPGKIKVGNLSVKRDFSHVKDIVRAYRMIIESDDCDTVYNVGSGIAYSLETMLNYLIGLTSQSVEIEVDIDRLRPNDQAVICCDNTLISSKLEWKPQYTIFDALQEMYEYYKLN